MNKVNFELIQRKILSTSFTLGVCGGLYLSAMKSFKSQYSLFVLIIQLLLLIIIGLAVGTILNHYAKKCYSKFLFIDSSGEIKLANQKIFFITIVIMVIAHFFNSQMNEWNQFSAVLITGGVFIISLINGIFDISSQATRVILSLGFIPVALSFILTYFTVRREDVTTLVWILGLLFFLSFLLILNQLQLNAQLFTAKDINVANRKKIRLFNSWAVTIFFFLCIVIIGFRKIISVSGEIIIRIGNWLYAVLAKFTIWLLNDPQQGSASEETKKRLQETTFEFSDKPVWEIIFVLTLIIILITIIILAFIGIKKSLNKMLKKNIINYDNLEEFDEESDIVRDRLRLKLREKFKYTLEKLDEIDDSGEKVRYLYGFVLERLYHYKIDISKSDTTEEIINKILTHENGQDLAEKGFSELTGKYRRVRYGNKKVDIGKELHQLGEVMEKAIKDLVVAPPK